MSSEIGPVSDTAPTDAHTSGGADDACAAASLDRQLQRLDRLAGAGMELVEALVAQAKGTGPKVVDGDVGLAFSRVSRAVRMAVLLLQQLSEGAVDRAKASQEAARQAEAGRKTAHVARVTRIVGRVAMDHCQIKPSRIGDYVYAARERLEDDDIYGLVATRPVGELVAMICRDFGLEPDWDALEQEAWAQAEIGSGAAGSPFLEPDDDEDAGDDETPPPPAGEVTRRGGGGEPEAEPRTLQPKTFQDRLTVLAQDPLIIAAARRDNG